jgi:O-antigen/teichoic acid export membrane protein
VKRKEHEPIGRTILKYSSSNIFQKFLGLFTAFIKPRILSPELYGLWNLLSMVPSYCDYLPFGARTAMRYRIPQNEATGDHAKNALIQGTVYYGTLVVSVLAAIGLVLYSFKGDLSIEARVGLYAVSVLVVLHWYHEYFVNVLKGYQNFSLITASNYLMAVASTALTIALVILFGIYGVYISAVASLAIVLVFLRSRYKVAPEAGFSHRLYFDLVKQGFPIILFGLASKLLKSSDRLVIAYMLGTEQLGYYGIAVMVFSTVLQIPGVARDVIEPKLMQSAARGTKEHALDEYFLKPLVSTAYLMPFMVGPVVIVLPVMIPLILPRYIPGILPAQLTVIGGYFLAMTYITRGIIVANRWQTWAVWITAFTVVVNLALSVLVIKLGFSLAGVAASSAISFFVLLACLVAFVRIKCGHSRKEWRSALSALAWPFPVMCATLLLLGRLSEAAGLNMYVAFVVETCVFVGVMYGLMRGLAVKYPYLKDLHLNSLLKPRQRKKAEETAEPGEEA